MRISAFAAGFLALRAGRTGRLKGSSGGGEVQTRRVLVLDPATQRFNELELAGYQVTAVHGMSDTELEQVLPGFDAVIVRSANRITRSMLLASPRVAIVGRAGSGVDNIDLETASELGVPVVHAPSGNAGSVAELVLGLMIGVSRSIPSAHKTMTRGEWAKKDFKGRTLNGKTLGIIGFGSVGQALARLAVALGMVVLLAEGFKVLPASEGVDEDNPVQPLSRREATAQGVGVTLPPLPLDELLSKVDFLSVHCPLTEDTKGMISERELALVKSSAVVINAARGGVVDEKALLRALEEGKLGGAALDVFAHEEAPLQDHVINLCRFGPGRCPCVDVNRSPNVLCTPHIGGLTEEAGERVLSEVCDLIFAFFEGRLPPSRIVNGNPDTKLSLARLPTSRPKNR